MSEIKQRLEILKASEEAERREPSTHTQQDGSAWTEGPFSLLTQKEREEDGI